MKEQRHLLSSLPLLGALQSALTTLIFHNAALTKVTPPPQAGSSAHLTYQQQPTQLLTLAAASGAVQDGPFPSFLALSAWLLFPTCHFCSAPGLKSHLYPCPQVSMLPLALCFAKSFLQLSPDLSSLSCGPLSPTVPSNIHFNMATVI